MKQLTLRKLLALSSVRPTLICPEDEVRGHRAYHPLVIGCPAVGIGPTRQWILERATADVIVTLDDDMTFTHRPVITSPVLKECPSLDPAFDLIRHCAAEGFVHGGLGMRQGNNWVDGGRVGEVLAEGLGLFSDNYRVNNAHFYRPGPVLTAGVRLDALPVMEDFHFTLSMLTRGFPNRVIQNIVWDQGSSGAEGGCSLYRTAEVQAAGADGLRAAFPDFVRVVTKKATSCWGGMGERKDVVIQWRKAFKSSGQKL